MTTACTPTRTAPQETATPRAPAAACTLDAPTLADALRNALLHARFQETIDFGPEENEGCPADEACQNKPITHLPNVDLAVIAFPKGCAPVYANVMLSRDFPNPRVNTIDSETLRVVDIRYRRWDIDRWNGMKGWKDNPPLNDGDDIFPGQQGPDFFVPYPASGFKILVAIQVLRLVEKKFLSLDDEHTYKETTHSLRTWMEAMIIQSDNMSTQALLQRIHELAMIEDMNEFFASLGLRTLRIDGTNPDGTGWNPGRIHMGAWDTARLYWLLDTEAPTPTWRTSLEKPRLSDFLTAPSKQLLRGFLRNQGFHETLSTTALCGVPDTQRGIPARMSDFWIKADGSVDVADVAMTRNVRPCNEAATVYFDHKTGLTFNYGSDAGIVQGIAGKSRRHYIIAYVGNLGYRYTDADKLNGLHPCSKRGICLPQRIPAMAAEIDAFLVQHLE